MNTPAFALFGAAPAFESPLPVGQLYFPSWERYESAFRDIFERQYYTNQGPLTAQLEARLQDFLGVRHVICVSNATIGLMMAAEAMQLRGKVILPAFTFVASAQSLSWTGLEPVFCDADASTGQIDLAQIEALIDDEVSAIMGVNLWGGACDPLALEALAHKHGLQLYFDSAHAFGCALDDRKIGNFGQLEVFSFHATKILSASEGGCISTNDDELAARLRNIRSSYGAGHTVPVVKTSNGRMSEAQAAIALMSLEDFPANQQNNAAQFQAYAEGLRDIPGITLTQPGGVSFSNYQYLVCSIDSERFGLERDRLMELLKAENVLARRYFYPGIHRCIPYAEKFPAYQSRLPQTDTLCASSMQLPIGALLTLEDIARICELLARAQRDATAIEQHARA
ncbi:aminotransferase class I/II-fold pyridoxal phosphate-dependent enzyme [Janthinobacterium sp. HLS12-2]|uniref:aminotransferase class I/II-fold pyridoxal phosphate-dependent enzyme n=1 Tax=Janthinobacterium sp. HLS12-2 TaxID=1259324 RepID=UPI003F20F2A0